MKPLCVYFASTALCCATALFASAEDGSERSSAGASAPALASDATSSASTLLVVDDPESPENGMHAVSLSYALTVASSYLFQGLDYSDGKAVVQPELSLGLRGFSASFWANHDLDQRVSNELDFVAAYGLEREMYSLGAGYAYYRYPHRPGWTPAHELLADVSVNSLLSPALSLHYDFSDGDGAYGTFSLSREIALTPVTLTPGLDLHYQHRYFAMTGIPSVALNAAATYSLGAFSVSPTLSYFATWENGDFRSDASVPSSWHFACSVGQDF